MKSTSDNVILIISENKPSWPVVYVTQNVEELLGYTAESFLSGENSLDFMVSQKDIMRVSSEIISNSTEKPCEYFKHKPYELKHKDGSFVLVDNQTYIQRDKAQEVRYFCSYIMESSETNSSIYDKLHTEKVHMSFLNNILNQSNKLV